MAVVLSEQMEMARFRRMVVEKVRVSVGAWVPEYALRNFELDRWQDDLAAQLVYQLSVYFASTSKTEEHKTSRVVKTVNVPLSWWDHVKERFAPTWFLVRWPVAYRTIETMLEEKSTVKHTRLCPHVDAPKNDYAHMEFLDFGREQ